MRYYLILALFFLSNNTYPCDPKDYAQLNTNYSPRTVYASLVRASQLPDFEDLTDLPNVTVDLRYGTTNNLLGIPVYNGYDHVILHKIAAEQFRTASEILARDYPELRFVIYDALRPGTAQRVFWQKVKGTEMQKYFADPELGSLHSYGFAIDLGLVDRKGRVLDMGTDFDDLTELAQPKLEDKFIESGKLTAAQLANRKILRSVMEAAGFLQLPHEWWHYNALPNEVVRSQYRIIE